MDLPQRKHIRLETYDYSSAGAYFVTVCTHDRRQILSSIRRGDPCGRPQLELTEYGHIIIQCLDKVSSVYGVSFDSFVIMPDHIHFICRWDTEQVTAKAALTLGHVVGALKSIAANQCRKAGLEEALCQRGYFEHVIRNDNDYSETLEYIESNPIRWLEKHGPSRTG